MVDIRKPAIQQAQRAATAQNVARTQGTLQQQAQAQAHRADNQRSQDAVYANRAARSGRRDNPPPPPPASGGGGRSRPRSINWRDSAYNAQIAAIDRALRDFETGLSTRGQRYGEDFTRGVRDLGFRDLEEGLAAVRRPRRPMPMARGLMGGEGAEPEAMTASEAMGGQWDLEGEFNPFSSAARGTRSSRDDFAGRGMIRSSDFAQSYAEFQDRLSQQLEGMETGRGRFFEDALTNLSSQRASAQERRAAAQRDAMMRAAIQAGR